ncbi:unnamed protein product, partial [Chrysoparadoxa australica]
MAKFSVKKLFLLAIFGFLAASVAALSLRAAETSDELALAEHEEDYNLVIAGEELKLGG